MKRILVNATQLEELRVAIVDGQSLVDLDLETPQREQKKSNIYKGRITRVEPSLEAAFVDYGSERHGFLPLKEIARSYFKNEQLPPAGQRLNIKELISEGQEVVVQVEKDERSNKGAALTTFISLAGRFLVLMPNNPRAGGVSRRIEGEERNEIREAINELNIPDGMGMIVRTAGVGRSIEELQWDLDYLIHVWTAVEAASQDRPAPFLIYQESNVIIRALRDLLRNDIGEILIDNEELFQQASDFMQQVMPHNLPKLMRYEDTVPLFTRFQIESQINSAYNRQVRLASGGSIVIDHTEALVSIDINSSRATKGADIEDTALHTNLEAAEEIARQLRLRDIGGLIVIDFIDMMQPRNQREVENVLRDCLKMDRARVQVGRISRFGLLEMSRQRLSASLGESSQSTCPRCNGTGNIRGIESLSLAVLRALEEDAMKDNTSRIIAQLPVKVATFLLNEKRDMIHAIERRQNIAIMLVPNIHMDSPNYEIKRIRHEDTDENLSYQIELTSAEEKESYGAQAQKIPPREVAAVTTVVPQSPPVTPKSIRAPGALSTFWKKVFGGKPKEKTEVKTDTRDSHSRQSRSTRGGRPQSNNNRRNNNNRNRSSGSRDGAPREPRYGQNTGSAPERSAQDNSNTRPESSRERYPQERGDRPPRTDLGDRNDRPPRADQGDRNDRPARADQGERNDRPPRADQGERNDRPMHNDRNDLNDRDDQPEYNERNDRNGNSDRNLPADNNAQASNGNPRESNRDRIPRGGERNRRNQRRHGRGDRGRSAQDNDSERQPNTQGKDAPSTAQSNFEKSPFPSTDGRGSQQEGSREQAVRDSGPRLQAEPRNTSEEAEGKVFSDHRDSSRAVAEEYRQSRARQAAEGMPELGQGTEQQEKMPRESTNEPVKIVVPQVQLSEKPAPKEHGTPPVKSVPGFRSALSSSTTGSPQQNSPESRPVAKDPVHEEH